MKQHFRLWTWLVGGVIGVPLAYTLGIIPVWWAVRHRHLAPTGTAYRLADYYLEPFRYVCFNGPAWLLPLLEKYLEFLEKL